jgi:very-short-patch-repair endonuclease
LGEVARPQAAQAAEDARVGAAFIADFAAPAVRLVVEVDGGCHRDRASADARRDSALRELGWRVVRVSARMVERELDAAVQLVADALRL